MLSAFWSLFLALWRKLFGVPTLGPSPAAPPSVAHDDALTPLERPVAASLAPSDAPAVGERPAVDRTAHLAWAFYEGLVTLEKRWGWSALGLLQVFFSESGVNPRAHHAVANPEHGAFGIGQLIVLDGIDNLEAVGWTRGGQAYLELPAEEQLVYEERYFAAHRTPRGAGGAQLYLVNYEPAKLAHAFEPGYVLDRAGDPYYAANASAFDPGHKGTITVDDLRLRLETVCRGAVWDEHVARLRYVQGDSLLAKVAKAAAGAAVVALVVGGVVWLTLDVLGKGRA